MSDTTNQETKQERELSPRLRQRWLGYAAAAAGGVLTTAAVGTADIITTHVNLPFAMYAPGCQPASWVCQSVMVPVNLTGGQSDNFELRATGYYNFSIGRVRLYFSGEGGTGAMGNAAALPKGTPIGPHGAFVGFANMVDAGGLFVYSRSTQPPPQWISGPWAGVSDAYLGLQLYVNGQVHYGWAELSVSAYSGRGEGGLDGEITAYGYETVASQGISAGQTSDTPEPGTLGLLALGSLGLAFRRKRKAVNTVKDTAA